MNKAAQANLPVPKFSQSPRTDKNIRATLLPLLLAIAAFAIGACASRPAPDTANTTSANTAPPISIIRVWPDYRTAESFDRISEYFTGAENTSGQIILRTHPDARAGFYLFTRLRLAAPVVAAQVEISIIPPPAPAATVSSVTTPAEAPTIQNPKSKIQNPITPASPDPKTYRLPLTAPLPKGTTLLNPGLTGPDWPDPTARPVAWRLRLLAPDGAIIASHQSYLWSK